MTEKLTLDICFKYPNARIRETLKGLYEINDEVDIHHDNLLDMLMEVDCSEWETLSDCKLILRPLSSLTDEEKGIVEDLHTEPDQCKIKVNSSNIYYVTANQFVIDYLRSINIDIDGLKERGIAEYEI